ncbi:heterokaryon incompatibility protein-domain-containing protein [Pestalotiopsis sp. NC0098]|nr:heterokaryon incompatibility protein-domain-containing protein [Pestalotiopsis sp. NC0098]
MILNKMSWSVQKRTQANEVDRPERQWFRPIELPEEDKSFHLCPRHRVMNLKKSDFLDWPKDKELPANIHFGLLAEVLERREYCVMCRLIAYAASHTRHARLAEVIGCWIPDGVLDGQEKNSLRLRIIPGMAVPEAAFAPFDIVPLGSFGKEPELFSGRRTNPRQIDLNLVQSWVGNCNKWHGVDCAGSSHRADRTTVFDPFIRLLDLKEDRLVELQDPEAYVALSYVWGTDRVFQTIGDNIEELKRPRGLSQHREMFPKSIQDATTLAKTLGYRYVWIDSICIIQDNKRDKMTQLAAMDRVYTQAALTIVAAGGENANAGLPGISPTSRILIQAVADYSSDLKLVALQPDCQVAVETTRWNKRGWTYQERLLSRRYLFFVNNTVYFQCAKAVWGEDYFADHKGLQQTAPMMDISLSVSSQAPVMTKRTSYRIDLPEPLASPAQDYLRDVLFPAYCQLIAEYTVRKMTFPTDRLNGIGGVLSVLDRHGHMDYLHGLPKPLLEAAILWRPQQYLTRVPVDPITGMPPWPSWSWAGWIGGAEYDSEHDSNGHTPLPNGSLRTRSITKMLC